MEFSIFTDGGSRGNPGEAACAFVVFVKGSSEPYFKSSFYLGKATNNFAEYSGLLNACEWLVDKGGSVESVDFFLDSELVVRQMNGVYKIKDANLLELYKKVKAMIQALGIKYSFNHVTRDKNSAADKLVNERLDQEFTRTS